MRGGAGSGAGRSAPAPMQIIDVGRDPSLKSALLQGRLQNLAAPFMYHDPLKQFCFVLMPMEMNLGTVEQERIIGQMTQAIMRGLPAESPKAYLLQPRTFFTLQSLMEAILEGDGITQEMLKAQQAKVDVLRELVRLTDPDLRRKAARDNDAKIDAAFFDLLGATMDANMQAGREAIVQQLGELQQLLIEETAYGKVVGRRMAVLEVFQKSPSREVLLAQLIVAEDAETREILVTVGRQMLDYAFFQMLTQHVDATTDAAEKERLVALRKEVQDIREKIDAAGRAYMQEKVGLVQTILASKDPLQTAREHAEQIDDAFMQVLQMNTQTAEQRGDANAIEALRFLQDIAMQVISERQPPEVQIIGALLQAEFPDGTKAILEEVKEFTDDRIISVMIQYADQLSQQDRSDTAAKMTRIIVQAREILPKFDPEKAAAQAGGAAPTAPSGLVGGSNPPQEPPKKPRIEIARR